MNPAYPALLSAFSTAVGLSEPELFLQTEELVIDEITVSFAYEGNDDIGEVVFFAQLGKPEASRLPEVAQVMMEANYLWVGTGGATLALSPKDQEVVCAARLPIDTLTGEALASVLDSFIDTATFWKRWLAGEINRPESALPTRPGALSTLRG